MANGLFELRFVLNEHASSTDVTALGVGLKGFHDQFLSGEQGQYGLDHPPGRSDENFAGEELRQIQSGAAPKSGHIDLVAYDGHPRDTREEFIAKLKSMIPKELVKEVLVDAIPWNINTSLDLAAVRRLPGVVNVIKHLSSLSSLPVAFHHTSDWQPSAPDDPHQLNSAALVLTDTCYDVYINEVLLEPMTVHELLHAVLVEEGYPEIKLESWKAPSDAPNRHAFERFYPCLVNKLQHPEIYRRMSEEGGVKSQMQQGRIGRGLRRGCDSRGVCGVGC